MQSTRRELVDELLDFVGESGDATARATANLLINRVLMKLWLKHPWSAFRSPTAYQFASVAATRSYALPVYFGRPQQQAVARNVTTGRQIYWRDQMDILEADPAAGTTLETAGEPESYFVGGTAGVSTQPASTGDALELLSSNASDTNVLVTIEGMDATGVEQRSQITLTGTTPVAAGTWSQIEEFSKALPSGTSETTVNTSSLGTVTLRKASAGATLESLLPDEAARQHTLVTLYRVPSQAWTFALPYIRAPRRLLYDSDVLPQFWGPAIFEELHIAWRVNTGELPDDGNVPRPCFLDLVSEDNRARRRPTTRAYQRP